MVHIPTFLYVFHEMFFITSFIRINWGSCIYHQVDHPLDMTGTFLMVHIPTFLYVFHEMFFITSFIRINWGSCIYHQVDHPLDMTGKVMVSLWVHAVTACTHKETITLPVRT